MFVYFIALKVNNSDYDSEPKSFIVKRNVLGLYAKLLQRNAKNEHEIQNLTLSLLETRYWLWSDGFTCNEYNRPSDVGYTSYGYYYLYGLLNLNIYMKWSMDS